VAATDYVGIGTPDASLYLVAQSEVRDVVNAVRAARNVPATQAGPRYAAWGHSQGGHSSIWTGHLGEEYAPELELVGVAAAAPALELRDIMGAQWNTLVGWVIGSDVVESWPQYYPDLPVNEVLTPVGQDIDARLASDCITQAGQTALVRKTLGQDFFAVDPTSVPAWAAAADDQTPAPLPAEMPVLIAQGTADTVVLPWPNAIVQEAWCAAGSSISMLWMGGVSHTAAATTAGPSAVAWLNDRFAGRPAPRTCDTPPPVAAQVPTPSEAS
jgi:alpha-beta hydrolase superfamily lysophospholipase